MLREARFQAEVGKLLLSEPTMSDAHFTRSVILLVTHNQEGSIGFMLNKPLDLKLSDMSNDLILHENELFEGGPVQLDTLHFIHRLGQRIEGSMQVTGDLYWGGDFDSMLEALPEAKPGDIRFFLGYSGWSPGQLEEELLGGAWLVTESDPSALLEVQPEELWYRSVKAMGGKRSHLADYPLDPSWN